MLRRLPMLCVIAAVGCSTAESVPRSGRITDSAGVRIVESAEPAWKSGEEWRLDSVPSLEIGAKGDDDRELFHYIRGVQRLSNGTIVVANQGTQQLRFFDSVGTFLRASGRKGKGPGEFSFLSAVYRCAGDTLVAEDNGGRRVEVFDSSGRFVRLFSIAGPTNAGYPRVVNPPTDCGSLAVVFFRISPTAALDRVERWPMTLWWAGPDGHVRDSVTTVPGGRTARSRLPWNGDPVFTAAGDRVFVGNSDDFVIDAFDQKGKLRESFRVRLPPRPITEAHRAAYAAIVAAEVKDAGPRAREMWDAINRLPVSDRLPWFNELIVSDDGVMWLRESAVIDGGYGATADPKPAAPPVTWYLLDRDGRWLGKVQTPAAFIVKSISHGMVYGVFYDTDYVEQIRGYRIVKR